MIRCISEISKDMLDCVEEENRVDCDCDWDWDSNIFYCMEEKNRIYSDFAEDSLKQTEKNMFHSVRFLPLPLPLFWEPYLTKK